MTVIPDPTDKAADGQFQPAREGEIERLIRLARSGASLYPGEGKKLVEHYEASARDAERLTAIERGLCVDPVTGGDGAILAWDAYWTGPFGSSDDSEVFTRKTLRDAIDAARAATREEG